MLQPKTSNDKTWPTKTKHSNNRDKQQHDKQWPTLHNEAHNDQSWPRWQTTTNHHKNKKMQNKTGQWQINTKLSKTWQTITQMTDIAHSRQTMIKHDKQ